MTASESSPEPPGSESDEKTPERRSRRSCTEAAVRLLADRAHFSRELESKLARRDYGASEIRETLARLAELGYLDEAAAVRTFVSEKRRRRGWGIVRLRAELARRGAERSAVDEVLDEIGAGEDEELARDELARWRRRGGGDPDRLARRLARRGIPSHVIVRLLNEVREELSTAESGDFPPPE